MCIEIFPDYKSAYGTNLYNLHRYIRTNWKKGNKKKTILFFLSICSILLSLLFYIGYLFKWLKKYLYFYPEKKNPTYTRNSIRKKNRYSINGIKIKWNKIANFANRKTDIGCTLPTIWMFASGFVSDPKSSNQKKKIILWKLYV